jgi:ribosome-associated heat shock protein Hsp15
MRIDKYLWSIRCYKTRNQASAAVKKGAVRINDTIAKPAKEVFPGDKVTYRLNQITHIIEVLDLPKARVGAKLVELYRVDRTPKEIRDQMGLIRGVKDGHRDRGTGRPTKKDRRDLDDFSINPEEDF